MITKELVEKVAQEYLKGTDYELQTCEIDKDKNILVEVDRLGVVDVDFCALLNRHIVAALEELTHKMDDYSLEVGSVSLTAPFKASGTVASSSVWMRIPLPWMRRKP